MNILPFVEASAVLFAEFSSPSVFFASFAGVSAAVFSPAVLFAEVSSPPAFFVSFGLFFNSVMILCEVSDFFAVAESRGFVGVSAAGFFFTSGVFAGSLLDICLGFAAVFAPTKIKEKKVNQN